MSGHVEGAVAGVVLGVLATLGVSYGTAVYQQAEAAIAELDDAAELRLGQLLVDLDDADEEWLDLCVRGR